MYQKMGRYCSPKHVVPIKYNQICFLCFILIKNKSKVHQEQRNKQLIVLIITIFMSKNEIKSKKM